MTGTLTPLHRLILLPLLAASVALTHAQNASSADQALRPTVAVTRSQPTRPAITPRAPTSSGSGSLGTPIAIPTIERPTGGQLSLTPQLPDISATLTAIGGSIDFPVPGTPVSSNEASQAITTFASQQLGIGIDLLYAGTATSSVQSLLAQLPAEAQAAFSSEVSISGATYWGLLRNGSAALAVGDCTTGNCTITADTLDVQLTSSAAGLYALLSGAIPTTPADALNLIVQTYPALNGLPWTQVTDEESGMAFTAITSTTRLDPTTKKPVTTAKAVYAGVVASGQQSLVYALVSIGDGYVKIVS